MSTTDKSASTKPDFTVKAKSWRIVHPDGAGYIGDVDMAIIIWDRLISQGVHGWDKCEPNRSMTETICKHEEIDGGVTKAELDENEGYDDPDDWMTKGCKILLMLTQYMSELTEL